MDIGSLIAQTLTIRMLRNYYNEIVTIGDQLDHGEIDEEEAAMMANAVDRRYVAMIMGKQKPPEGGGFLKE